MKLYDCTSAPSPRRVRMFAAEKNIELTLVQVDLASGEQLSDKFRQRNRDCTVPVLELDDGTCVSEVMAICDYLEQSKPLPALIGTNPVERARVLMWNGKIEQQGLSSLADLFRNTARGMKSRAVTGPDEFEQIPELAERGRRRAQLFFERLDAHMDGREFIAADFLSVADITAFISVEFARWSKLDFLASAKNLERWYESMVSRPSAKA